MRKINPAGHRVLVRVKKLEENTTGGLYLPQQAQEMEQHAMEEGEVVAIGPQAWKAFDDGTPWAKIGDTVTFARYAGLMKDGDGGQKYRIMQDEDIYAVIVEE
jgi:chaperonin GroES